MFKKWLALGLVAMMGSAVQADTIRTALTKENRRPDRYRAEAGMIFTYFEMENDDKATSLAPYMRYTVLPDLVLFGTLPFENIDHDQGSSSSGLGDATVGAELRVYEDLFRAPWIMPHAEVSFPTGDEDKGLGSGEMEYMVGVAVGSSIYRHLHYAVDARYRILNDRDNVPSLGVSLIYDLDERFSLLAEMQVSNESIDNDFGQSSSRSPILFLAGMHYAPIPALSFTVHGGAESDSGRESIIRAKMAYLF